MRKNVSELSGNFFVRTHFTWLAYALLGYYAYLQSSVGPLMPFLSAELHINYAIEGLHFSAFSLGTVLVGLSGDRMIRLFGRRSIFWGGAGGMALGVVALVLGHVSALTLLSIFLMGYTGNLLLMTIQSTLSDQYQEQRSVALTEANVMASIAAGLAPLGIGGLEHTALGWRSALVVMVMIFLLLFLLGRNVALPSHSRVVEASSSPSLGPGPFPLAFWAYWSVVLLGVACEWCIVYWGATFLAQGGQLSKDAAASLLSLFFLAAIVGRVIGSRLARHLTGSQLLFLSVMLAVGGFPLFWLVSIVPLRLIGLFITGMGVANFWPSGIALTLGMVPRYSDATSARITLGAGIAVLIAPLVLGWLADHVGIQRAYSVVALLLLLMTAMVMIAHYQAKRDVLTVVKESPVMASALSLPPRDTTPPPSLETL